MLKGTFLRRLNRFTAEVTLEGELKRAFLPNSGKLQEVLVEGREVLLRPSPDPRRKTTLDLWGVFDGRIWILIDSRWANRLLPWAAKKGLIHALKGIKSLRREIRVLGKRLDFLAQRRDGRIWVESKAVTLVKDGIALFPDAQTLRGRSHLEVLRELKLKGEEALVVFMVLREDAHAFTPHWAVDPAFSQALCEAAATGVGIEAVCFRIGEGEVLDGWPIPVIL